MWLIFDGNNHIHRDWHAAGESAAKLFMRRVFALRDKFSPDRIVVAFDSDGSFRNQIDQRYKADRAPTPPEVTDLIEQTKLSLLRESIDVVAVRGFEADDIIATITHIGLAADQKVVIVSGDKDLRQLLMDGYVVQLVSCKRDGGELTLDYFNAQRLESEYGVQPWQWIDYQTICGDSTDGVVGAKGIGPKVAVEILKKCHSLDAYYLNQWPANLTKRQHTLMAAFRNEYKTVRRLVTLVRNVPLPAGWLEPSEAVP